MDSLKYYGVYTSMKRSRAAMLHMESYTAASRRARCECEERGRCSVQGMGILLLNVHLRLSQLNKYYVKQASLDRNVSSNPASEKIYLEVLFLCQICISSLCSIL